MFTLFFALNGTRLHTYHTQSKPRHIHASCAYGCCNALRRRVTLPITGCRCFHRKLEEEHEEHQDRVICREYLEREYTEESLGSGIAADEVESNIKKALAAYQPEEQLQKIHDAQVSVKFAEVQMRKTEKKLQETRKELGAIDRKIEDMEAQKQHLDGEVL